MSRGLLQRWVQSHLEKVKRSPDISREVLVTRLFIYNLGEFLEKWCKDPGQLIKLLVVVPGKCQ